MISKNTNTIFNTILKDKESDVSINELTDSINEIKLDNGLEPKSANNHITNEILTEKTSSRNNEKVNVDSQPNQIDSGCKQVLNETNIELNSNLLDEK